MLLEGHCVDGVPNLQQTPPPSLWHRTTGDLPTAGLYAYMFYLQTGHLCTHPINWPDRRTAHFTTKLTCIWSLPRSQFHHRLGKSAHIYRGSCFVFKENQTIPRVMTCVGKIRSPSTPNSMVPTSISTYGR